MQPVEDMAARLAVEVWVRVGAIGELWDAPGKSRRALQHSQISRRVRARSSSLTRIGKRQLLFAVHATPQLRLLCGPAIFRDLHTQHARQRLSRSFARAL